MASHIKKEQWDSIYWHDGHLDGLKFSIEEGSANILLNLRLYDDHQAPKRKFVEARFSEVISWQCTCDIKELLHQRWAGEIIDANIKFLNRNKKTGKLTFRMFVCDGYLEIISKDAIITKKKSAP